MKTGDKLIPITKEEKKLIIYGLDFIGRDRSDYNKYCRLIEKLSQGHLVVIVNPKNNMSK